MGKELGAKSARKLRARLADLRAAANVSQVKRGRPHPLKGKFDGCLDLDSGHRLVIRPVDNPPPTRPDGGLDWSQVEAVLVTYIGDYHD